MSPLDWLLFRRSLAAQSAALVVVFGVIAATDELTSTLAMRVARLCAFSPFVGALCVLGVSIHARSRGELRAVESLGATPSQASRGAALAAFVLALLAVAVLASPAADARSLLPAVHAGVDWTFDADGRLARALGIAIAADGRITLLGGNPLSPSTPPQGWLAMPCLAPVALLCPAWAVAPMSRTARIASLVLTGGGVITLLHLIAGARITPAAGVLACCPLAIALLVSRSGQQRAGAGLH
jgi:hypothetical protein